MVADKSIKGIVFDLGNVLLPFNPWQAVDNLAHASGRSRWLIAAYFFITKRWDHFDEGRYARDAFCRKVIDDLHLHISQDIFEAAFKDMFRVNEKIIALLPQLKKKYRLFLLSDNNPIHSEHCLQRHDFFLEFESVVFSFRLKCRKPAPRMYHSIMSTSGLSPQELLFVDDKIENVRGAQNVGMNAIHFTGQDSFLKTLFSSGWITL